jgi:hypothetical protein
MPRDKYFEINYETNMQPCVSWPTFSLSVDNWRVVQLPAKYTGDRKVARQIKIFTGGYFSTQVDWIHTHTVSLGLHMSPSQDTW